MRQLDGSVHIGSGMIHAYGAAYRPQAAARKAREAIPEDTRPIHVRMREMKDSGARWEDLADRFGYASANGVRTYLLRKEREAVR